jgi:hypothetical protein
MKSIFLFVIICFNSYVFGGNYSLNCDEFDLKNYKKILENKKSGYYKNPFFKDSCFHLSFKREKNVLLGYENFNIEESYRYFLIERNIKVTHFFTEKKIIKFLKFDTESKYYRFIKENMIKTINGDLIKDITFLHEIYHLSLKIDGDTYENEVLADIFAVNVLRDQLYIDEDEFIYLTKQMRNYRTMLFNSNKYNSKHNSIYEFFINTNIKNRSTSFLEIQESILEILDQQ